jgi:hypothetical protein
MRFFIGLFKPSLLITGSDFAGEVDEIGKSARSFKDHDKNPFWIIITRLLGGKKAVFSIPKNVNGSMAFYQGPH